MHSNATTHLRLPQGEKGTNFHRYHCFTSSILSVRSKRRFGISAQVVKSEEFNDPDNHLRKEITEGKFQLLYISLEFLLQSLVWRELLRSTVYTENLIAFIIDERVQSANGGYSTLE